MFCEAGLWMNSKHFGWIHITFPLSPLYMSGYARPLRLQSCLPCQFTPELFQGFSRKDKCRIVKQEMNCWRCRTNADAHCLQYSCELEIEWCCYRNTVPKCNDICDGINHGLQLSICQCNNSMQARGIELRFFSCCNFCLQWVPQTTCMVTWPKLQLVFIGCVNPRFENLRLCIRSDCTTK